MTTSVLSRIALAALICASLGGVAARAQEPSTGSQFRHASKCVLTLGFGGDCDKNAPAPKGAKAEKGEAGPAPVRPVDETSTRLRFMHAGACLVTVGFSRGCDKDAPAPKAEKSVAGPEDTSTRHQFVHAGTCVVSLGFVGDCDKR